MPPWSRLPLAALLAVGLAGRADEAVRSDGTHLAGTLRLTTGRFRFGHEPVAGLDRVRFSVTPPAAPPAPLRHQVHLADGQVVLAELVRLDEAGLHVRPAWADRLTVPRAAVERVTHVPGWRPVLFDPFETLDGWKTAGGPAARDGALVLDWAGQAAEVALRAPAARVGVSVRLEGAGRRASLDLGFVRDGKPNPVRVEFAGPGEAFAVTAADRPEHVGTVRRGAGRRRLVVEFDRARLAVLVDDLVVWAGDAGPGELRSLRFVAEGEGAGAAAVEDVAVLVPDPPAGPRAWADLTADAVRSPAGEETFGTLAAVGPAGVTLEVRGRRAVRAWPDVAEWAFRRGPRAETATGGEHVRVRVRAAEGQVDVLDGAVTAFDDRALVLAHPVLGELTLPRDRVEEVRFRFHGRRVPVESAPHHLGARPAFGFAVPKPEGLSLARTVRTERPAGGWVVVEAARVSGPGTPVEVLVNGQPVGELNRFAGRPRAEVQTYRLPVGPGVLRRGDNEVEVRLRPAGGERVTGIDLRAVRLELADPR